jgi:hypothetical protein
MRLPSVKRWPNTNMGWHEYYVRWFNKIQAAAALYLADLYLLFHLAFGDERISA